MNCPKSLSYQKTLFGPLGIKNIQCNNCGVSVGQISTNVVKMARKDAHEYFSPKNK